MTNAEFDAALVRARSILFIEQMNADWRLGELRAREAALRLTVAGAVR